MDGKIEQREAKTEARPYQLDDQVGYLLRLANQRHTSIFVSRSRHNLTATQFSAIVRLAEIGSCSQNQLGRLVGMDIATIKGVVDRLIQKNWVEVKPDMQDRRRSVISLTTAGQDMVEDLKETGHAITDETLAPLSPPDREALIRILRLIS